jgi:hypothetical protein
VIEITEVNPNKLTSLTKQNLFHLAKVYDLKPFLFTKQIHVQSYVVPHSHPILTMNTRNAENPNRLLASWLHEEFHWWTEQNKAQTERAIVDLKKIFPDKAHSTYLHLVICYLEYRSLAHYLGTKDAREEIQEVVNDDKLYPWIYAQVMNNPEVDKIVKKHKLLPPPLS